MATSTEDIVYRLRKRAEIRRQISTRKSVQEGKPDRLADLLDEAAAEIERLRTPVPFRRGPVQISEADVELLKKDPAPLKIPFPVDIEED